MFLDLARLLTYSQVVCCVSFDAIHLSLITHARKSISKRLLFLAELSNSVHLPGNILWVGLALRLGER